MVYTYVIPNQWNTKVQSLKPGLTHYIHVGDTYIAGTKEQVDEMANLYRTRSIKPEVGELKQ